MVQRILKMSEERAAQAYIQTICIRWPSINKCGATALACMDSKGSKTSAPAINGKTLKMYN